jgi:small redox-active disulfide protein 2
MVDLKILGTGCPKCKKLEERTRKAADELGISYELEKVTDINKIMSYRIMMTPALVINGEVRIAGKVLTVEEIQDILKQVEA